MITVDEACRLVLENAQAAAPTQCAGFKALGCVLAQDIVATIDSPPHDKALMDGYAVRAEDVARPGATLTILEQLTAGQMPSRTVEIGTATRIMTGAPIPPGADAVVMFERTENLSPGESEARVRFQDPAAVRGQNILRRGVSIRQGDTILRAGHVLRPLEIGLLAELGEMHALVYPSPSVAILATGNELVKGDDRPGPGQIRNSNGPMLECLVLESGGRPFDLGIARDEEEDLKHGIQAGLEHDVLILSGGVSAGDLDLVPQVLVRLGVEEVFHKVKLKPGKPIWFGVRSCSDGRKKLVFGLPGNPVSSLVCFLLFVRPALERIAGRSQVDHRRRHATMAVDFPLKSDRPTFYPGRAVDENGTWRVTPLNWRGSSDLAALAQANVLIYFPAGTTTVRADEPVTVYQL